MDRNNRNQKDMMETQTDERWHEVKRIWEIIDQLRGEPGCPWDRKQTPESVQTYLVEEAHEAAAAVRSGDLAEASEELGDLLFMVFFLIHLYQEAGRFKLEDVGRKICSKMIRRHPHVFGDVSVHSAGEVRDNWEKIKAGEKQKSRNNNTDSVPETLPGLIRAYRLLSRMCRTQPQWEDRKIAADRCLETVQKIAADQARDGAIAEQDIAGAILQLVNLARLHDYRAEDSLHGYLSGWVSGKTDPGADRA